MTDVTSASAPAADPIDTTGPTCVLCQHMPAAATTVYQVSGVLVYLRWSREQGPFCRDCGITLFRDATARSLTSGIWHFLAPVLVPLVVARNLAARRAVTALAEPRPHPVLAAPNHRPLVPGRPVLRRPGSWLALALLAVLVAVVPQVVGPGGERYDRAGGCVRRSTPLGMYDAVRFVSCSDMHDARVEAVVADWTRCASYDGYVIDGGRFYCITDESPAAGAH
ncbi:hypothetical protein Cs7R123_21850 [Catellatospora sp. TT07R-123]|uniref:hypothetical protein n=1 Tax=Catellatospora sp. TT07R-123 TaxID=2733863 RepID=UPI001B263795|nr:hypothetical protein [Catellatospora sp. TT07R-123]GHJ44843.1 hypothetical protein Cs7R123_21850 [Catellatospora sp. TT07R-123]